MEWVTIDFEASCLPRDGRSFPIEVGISGPLGTQSWLIKPLAEWQAWDWTDEAFQLHGISRSRLDAEGLDPNFVVAEVRRAVGLARVIADSPIDAIWWQKLLDAAAKSAAPVAPGGIDIEQVSDIFDEWGATPQQILFAQRRAEWLCPERHRAGADAHWLFTLLSTLSDRIAADREEIRETWPSEVSGDFRAPVDRTSYIRAR